jgi:fermentation-respiration switch protein FrsA (DUF1100 family)
VFQRQILFPRHLVQENAGWTMPNVEKISIRTSDGETLKGYWRPPSDEDGKVVVSFTGNAEPSEVPAFRFANGPWKSEGWGFVTISYRGYPGSSGTPSEKGILLDGEAAVAFVSEKAPKASMLFHGLSMGSGVAVTMASRHPSLGVYLEAPYDSMSDVVYTHYPILPGFLLRDTLRSDRRLCAVTSQLFFVHGSDDKLIPPTLGRKLFDTRSKEAMSVFRLIEGGTHMSIMQSSDIEAEKFFEGSARRTPKPYEGDYACP